MSAEDHLPAERTWRYQTWGGSVSTVVGYGIAFEATHVVWRDAAGRVILAERPENVNQLAEVGNAGSSTRGVRP